MRLKNNKEVLSEIVKTMGKENEIETLSDFSEHVSLAEGLITILSSAETIQLLDAFLLSKNIIAEKDLCKLTIHI